MFFVFHAFFRPNPTQTQTRKNSELKSRRFAFKALLNVILTNSALFGFLLFAWTPIDSLSALLRPIHFRQTQSRFDNFNQRISLLLYASSWSKTTPFQSIQCGESCTLYAAVLSIRAKIVRATFTRTCV